MYLFKDAARVHLVSNFIIFSFFKYLPVCKLPEGTATRSANLRGENINEEVHRHLSLIDPKTVVMKDNSGLGVSFAEPSIPCEAITGEHFHIFCPSHDLKGYVETSFPQVLAAPETWLLNLESLLQFADSVVDGNDARSVLERARSTYLELLKNYVSGIVYGQEERSVSASRHIHLRP